MSYAILAGYLICALMVITVPILVSGTFEHTSVFWYRIAWVEFLFLINWVYIGWNASKTVPSRNNIRQLGGILPATGLSLTIYSVLSLCVLLMQTVFINNIFIQRLHLAIQIVLLGSLMILFVFFYISFRSAISGTTDISTTGTKPSFLAAEIEQLESYLRRIASEDQEEAESNCIRGIVEQLGILRGKLIYSLPNHEGILLDQDYIVFSGNFELLKEEVYHQGKSKDKAVDFYTSLNNKVRDLVNVIERLTCGNKRY
jgi:hypothetical protein